MDTFVRKFFPKHESPGAAFRLSSECETSTFFNAITRTKQEEKHQVSRYTASQSMTPAGLLIAQVSGSESNLDGINRRYVLPEGTIFKHLFCDAMQNICGMNQQAWSRHMALMKTWNWGDNHVTLLINALRFVFLRELTADAGNNLNVALSNLIDGRIAVDRNQYFTDEYPAANEWEWPCGTADDALPAFTHLTAATPPDGTPVMDLCGLSQQEAAFMLLMTGTWRRRSRYRLDFALPRLAEKLQFRHAADVGTFSFTEASPDPRLPAPPLATKELAWGALRRYVTRNRLFGQFSTALYMVCVMAYQFLPPTAEGTYWLSLEWKASLPAFHPIRGRYVLLNDGEPIKVNRGALSEWNFINNQIQKVNLMALIFSQAAHTGLAVRSTRRGLEDNPSDLYNKEGDFCSAINMFSAAASECAQSQAPFSGISDVYLYCTEDFERYSTTRYVVTTNTAQGDLAGHDSEVVSVGRDNQVRLLVRWMPLPGAPLLLLPLNCFPYKTPFELKGKLDPTDGKAYRNHWSIEWHKAWEVAHLYNLGGYSLLYTNDNGVAGPTSFISPPETHFTWPVMRKPGHQDMKAHISGRTEPGKAILEIVNVATMFEKVMDYETEVLEHGVAAGTGVRASLLSDYSAAIIVSLESSGEIKVDPGVSRLRRWIMSQKDSSELTFDTPEPIVFPPQWEIDR